MLPCSAAPFECQKALAKYPSFSILLHHFPVGSRSWVRSSSRNMAMPLGDLGWEVSSIILKLLDIDDAVCLYNALQFQYKNGTRYDHNFLFNWIDITQLERGNMLTNTHFSVRMRSDPNQNRNPINLRPSPASGLPQTRTYYDLLRDPLVLTPAHVLRQKKTEDLRVLRHSLLFTSRKFREGLDIPGERSRRILKLTLGSNSTYPQILQNLPNGKTREDVTACRLRDDRSNTEFQEQALMKVLFRMQADPLFLPRTCRKCCIHTRQNGQDSNYAEANGVVYCTTCMRKHLLATGYIGMSLLFSIVSPLADRPLAFDEIFLINRDISLDAVSMRSGGILTTLSRHYVSKEDSEILANCFAGMSLFDLQSRLFAAPSAYGGRDAAQKFNFCSQATYHAIKWYTMRTSSGYPLGYRLPNTTSQGAMKDNLGMKLTSKSSVLKIYRAMARHYDRLSKNYRQGFQYTKRLGEAIRCAARFWHEQLFDCGLICKSCLEMNLSETTVC